MSFNDLRVGIKCALFLSEANESDGPGAAAARAVSNEE
jgi:hypothetical protein